MTQTFNIGIGVLNHYSYYFGIYDSNYKLLLSNRLDAPQQNNGLNLSVTSTDKLYLQIIVYTSYGKCELYSYGLTSGSAGQYTVLLYPNSSSQPPLVVDLSLTNTTTLNLYNSDITSYVTTSSGSCNYTTLGSSTPNTTNLNNNTNTLLPNYICVDNDSLNNLKSNGSNGSSGSSGSTTSSKSSTIIIMCVLIFIVILIVIIVIVIFIIKKKKNNKNETTDEPEPDETKTEETNNQDQPKS